MCTNVNVLLTFCLPYPSSLFFCSRIMTIIMKTSLYFFPLVFLISFTSIQAFPIFKLSPDLIPISLNIHSFIEGIKALDFLLTTKPIYYHMQQSKTIDKNRWENQPVNAQSLHISYSFLKCLNKERN